MSGGGISRAYASLHLAPDRITTPAPHHSVFYRPDALPAAQPTASKHRRHSLVLTKHKFKNWSYLCAYRCAQLSYTTQHRAVLTILPLYLHTTIIALLQGRGGSRGVTRVTSHPPPPARQPVSCYYYARDLSYFDITNAQLSYSRKPRPAH